MRVGGNSMVRRFLLVSILCLCTAVAAFAQNGAGGTSGGSTGGTTAGSGTLAEGGLPSTAGTIGGVSGQAASGPLNSPSGNTGIPTVQQTMGGPAGTTGTNQGDPNNLNTFPPGTNTGFIGISGGGTLSTPTATFAAPAPTAGISDSGRAGISDLNPVNTGVQSTLGNSTLVLTGASPVNPRMINTAALTSGRLINDLGPSVFIGSVDHTTAPLSLGEIAAKYKSRQGAQNARTITNADVERLLGSSATAGNSGSAMVASNMPPSGLPAPGQNSQTPQPTATAPQSSTTSQSQPSGQAANAATTQSNDTAASSSTTPQVNQAQPGNTNESNRLPATSTILPLLGLLGIASSGVGLWYRKFRK